MRRLTAVVMALTGAAGFARLLRRGFGASPEVATLGVYRAVAGELDTSVLEQWARGRGIETYVPVLDGRQLRFAPSTPTTSACGTRANRARASSGCR